MRVDYVWEAAYQAALLETDDKKLQSRFQAAKAAVDARLNERPSTPEELQAITDALHGISVPQIELEKRSRDGGSNKA